VLDTNCDPDGVSHPIPGNDDAGRAIALYCDLVARAAIDGISRSQGAMGVDIGAAETPDVEPAVEAGRVIREDLRTAEEVAAADAEAPGEAFELLSAPRGAPDDLAKLHGVGPQLIKKLNDAGVYHYWQLAAMRPADVEKLDAELKLNGRIARDGWVDQAKALLAA